MKKGFRELTVWQKSYEFGLELYKLTMTLKSDANVLVYQIRKAALSISANIAEGYERQHRKEYIQFLSIAKGSLGELENYLFYLRDLNYITQQRYKDLESKRQEIAILLRALIKSLSPSPL